MGEETALIELLKALLKREVDLFCRRMDEGWKQPISSTLADIRRNNWRAVFFGGTLRSLLLARLAHQRSGRPRDVDIVVHSPPLDVLRRQFENVVSRETRFGGLQLRRADSLFDVWPLEKTWALVQDRISHPGFADLPRTTFLNIEAIAVEIWPSEEGKERMVFSDNDQFFQAVLRRVLDINKIENPYPDLCVVRSLVMAHETGFSVSGRLARYIVDHALRLTPRDVDAVQEKHYGLIRVLGSTMTNWISRIAETLDQDPFITVVHSGMPGSSDIDADPEKYEYLQVVRRWQRRYASLRQLQPQG